MKIKITETTDTTISFYIEKNGEIIIEETLKIEELIRYVYLKNRIESQYLGKLSKALR